MDIIETAKQLAVIAKKIGDRELYAQIVELQGEVVQLEGEKVEFSRANQELSAMLEAAEKVGRVR